MVSGILAGMCWAIETIVLSIVLKMTPFVQNEQTLFLAPFVATCVHDLLSSCWAFLLNAIQGNLSKVIFILLHTKAGKYVALGAIIGGPIGMSGYVLAIQYMGASMGAVASAIFPAIGSLLAWIFLKEKISWYRWIFLILTMLGVFGLGYSSNLEIQNFLVGILGVIMCSFGWGSEAVILAKTLQDEEVEDAYILPIRQLSSCLFYGLVLLPLFHGWRLTFEIICSNSILIVIGLAAFFATISYLFYYRAIERIGPTKAMALNVSYSAWAVIFSVLFFQEYELLNPLTILCTLTVLICGILSATDIQELF